MGNTNTTTNANSGITYVILVPQFDTRNKANGEPKVGVLYSPGAMKYRQAVALSTHRSPNAALEALENANEEFDGRADLAVSYAA